MMTETFWSLFLGIIPPIMAIIYAKLNPIDDEYVKNQVGLTIDATPIREWPDDPEDEQGNQKQEVKDAIELTAKGIIAANGIFASIMSLSISGIIILREIWHHYLIVFIVIAALGVLYLRINRIVVGKSAYSLAHELATTWRGRLGYPWVELLNKYTVRFNITLAVMVFFSVMYSLYSNCGSWIQPYLSMEMSICGASESAPSSQKGLWMPTGRV